EGTASTEDLRLAMLHYRALFGDLLGQAAARPAPGPGPETGTTAGTADAGAEPTVPWRGPAS
ncbi:MAG TPA: hypothetical protein VLW53_14735, partial [Candidatus Eisenbacteria bacterium]|nr:hypothetical protein [Candidatus Eisenbacteria bacterium]